MGNGNIDIGAIIRNDNSIVVEHVRPINSVTQERRSNGSVESNREESETKPWLVLSHITGILNIPEEVAKSATRKRLILVPSRSISQSVTRNGKDEIRKTYTSDRQYLAFRETKEGLKYLHTFERRRDGAGSWQMLKRIPLLLIKIRTMGIKTKNKKGPGVFDNISLILRDAEDFWEVSNSH